MVATTTTERRAVIARTEGDVRRWSSYVDTLVRAFRSNDEAPPVLRCKVEELRNKRDSVVTKAEALKHHQQAGWNQAKNELDDARRELRDSWRTVIGTIDRESLFV